MTKEEWEFDKDGKRFDGEDLNTNAKSPIAVEITMMLRNEIGRGFDAGGGGDIVCNSDREIGQ